MESPINMLSGTDMAHVAKKAFADFELQRKGLEQGGTDKELQAISKKMGIDARKLSSVALDDARMVNRMDEDFKRVTRHLVKVKNTCTFSEYRDKWFALHELIHPDMPDYQERVNERRALSVEYLDRFMPNYPINIVSDHDPNEVLVTLPPQYMTVNTIQGDPSQVIDAFTNHSAKNLAHLIPQSGGLLTKLMYIVQNKTNADINKARLACFEANIKVLQLFNPDHPLLKKLQEIVDAHEKEMISKDTKEDNINENGGIDDTNGIDFF